VLTQHVVGFQRVWTFTTHAARLLNRLHDFITLTKHIFFKLKLWLNSKNETQENERIATLISQAILALRQRK